MRTYSYQENRGLGLQKWLEEMLPLDQLEGLCYLEYEPSEQVMSVGDVNRRLMVLLSGTVSVHIFSENGKPLVLCYGKPPFALGDLELFTVGHVSQNVFATSKALFLAIPLDRNRHTLETSAAFLYYMCGQLAEKLSQSARKHSERSLYSCKYQLVRYLLRRAEKEGTRLSFRQVEVAAYLGVTPRHIRRIVGELEESGWIGKQGRSLVLLNQRALEEEYGQENV